MNAPIKQDPALEQAVASALPATPKTSPKKSRSPFVRFAFSVLLFVGLPTLIAGVYYWVYASPIYVSETKFAIRSVGQQLTRSLAASMMAIGGGFTSEENIVIRDYVWSRDMLDKLDEKLDLKEHYSAPSIDWWARLAPDAGYEEFLEYYQGKVEISIETGTGITTLTARAFTREVARDIARTLVEESEDLVNQMSNRIQQDTMSFVRADLDEAEQQLRSATAKLSEYRSKTHTIDPKNDVKALLRITTDLEIQLAFARAELTGLREFRKPSTAKVRMAQSRVEALENQVRESRERVAGSSSTNLSGALGDYSPLELEETIAQGRYAATLAVYEQERRQTMRKHQYVVTFVEPDLPRVAREPDRVLETTTVFVGAILLYGIGGLVLTGFRDHAGL